MANFFGLEEYEESAPKLYDNGGLWLEGTCEVGSFAPNAWGLYDMVGNVHEWCQDWWAASYPGGSLTNWQGPANPKPSYPYKIMRGGSWEVDGVYCRSAARAQDYPDDRAQPDSNPYALNDVGFRIVLAPNNP